MTNKSIKIRFEDVKPGKFFVKDYLVREILEDLGYEISYYTYILNSGEPIDDYRGICSKNHIVKWAEREATAEEKSKMDHFQARILERNSSSILMANMLRATPEEWILNEIQLRSNVDHKIFVSYSHKDKDYAHLLAREFESNLLEPWLDDRIDYGSQWPKVLQDMIIKCPTFVILMSSNAYQSIWVQNELSYAQTRKKQIFPLLLEGEVWLSLAAVQYVDVTDGKLPPQKFYSRIKKVLANQNREAKAVNSE